MLINTKRLEALGFNVQYVEEGMLITVEHPDNELADTIHKELTVRDFSRIEADIIMDKMMNEINKVQVGKAIDNYTPRVTQRDPTWD